MSASEFASRHVAVIGAAVGLGPAVVETFTAAGARVTVDEPALDVRTPAAIPAFFDAAEAANGPLDILVIAARPVQSAPALSYTPETISDIVESELVGVILCMQEAARRMEPRGYGRIISFVSMSAKTGVHTRVGPYAAAKAGVLAFTRVLAAELAPTGVTVNAIATALFEPQVVHLVGEPRAHLAKEIPVGRFGKPAEAGRAVLYLASDDAAYTTGETLNLSGGRFMD